MAFDTRAFAKRLKKAGIKRKQVRAHVEAMTRYLRPALATKSDLAALEQSTMAGLLALEQRIDGRLSWLERRPEGPIPLTQIHALGVVAATLAVLFVLRALTESGRGERAQPRRIATADRVDDD